MKSATRFAPLGVILVISAAVLIAAETVPGLPGGLTVHEWGTFTSVAGEDGSALEWNTLGCKNDLPGFVQDYGFRGFKFRLTGTVRMETPVMYFYSPREMEARVKVQFPRGLITEWYPQATYDIYQKGRDGTMRPLAANLNGIDVSMRTVMGAIEWKSVKVQPDAAPSFPTEKTASRYYAARETDAAPLLVGGQREKFLFYRGVGEFKVPLSVRLADGKVAVENRGDFPVRNLILFENRGGHIGYRTAELNHSTTLDAPPLNASLDELRSALESTLIAHGLFAKEAHAMVETWRDSWFEEGSRLIYILPSPLVEAILPLQVEPATSRTERVFVGRVELMTPKTLEDLESAVLKGDWPAADQYTRFIDPILHRIASGNPITGKQIEALFRAHQAQTPCR